MADSAGLPSLPSLPQRDDAATSARRKYELSLARTAYNYTTSYLYPAPLSAQVPKGEKFSIAYEAKVAPILIEVAANLKRVLVKLFERELLELRRTQIDHRCMVGIDCMRAQQDHIAVGLEWILPAGFEGGSDLGKAPPQGPPGIIGNIPEHLA